MNSEMQNAISYKLQTLADDELILAHRNSEWTGHGPILEEDIAFTNIALDEMGHAATWLRLRQELMGEEADTAVFFREAADFRNVQLVELPNGDWAFSMLRQYLFDVYELLHLAQLANSDYQPLAEAAAKIRSEEVYHLRHTSNWIKRLGLGTDESRERMQNALDLLWPYAQQLFEPLPVESILVEEQVVTPTSMIYEAWVEKTTGHLVNAGLIMPTYQSLPASNRSQHTGDLAILLNEMQSVARLDPEAQW